MENNQMPGGYLVGDSHANGGIKIKTPEGQIEAEGGEVIINKRALALQDKYVCEGTPKEMTSKINEMEGGVSWSNTGSCRLVRQAADGTEIEEEASIADDGFGLLYTKNNKTYIITTDTKDQLEIVEMALTDFKDGLINKEELENTLQSNIDEEVEFTAQIDMISGKPFAYDQFYGGYIELMSSEPINIDYSSAMAEDGSRIGTDVDYEFDETEKAALGSFIFGKEYKIENDKPFRIEVKNKISDMEREFDGIKKDYRYGILDTEEYFELKKELVDKYAVYINAAQRLDIVVNQGLFMGLKKEKDDTPPTEQAGSGSILRSSNPEKRPSPSVSATIYPAGYTMEGNDGNMWEIALDSRGIHRWKRMKAEDGMSMAEDGKSMFPKSQINYGFNFIQTNDDNNRVEYLYTFYKGDSPVCDVYFDVIIGADDRPVNDFGFDYSTERTYSKDYIVTEMVAVEYNIVDYIEIGEEIYPDNRVSLSPEDMSRVSSEIDAIFSEKVAGQTKPNTIFLTKEEKNNILASKNLAANGKQISKCDCGCGIAKDGAEVSSCGCSHSKYTNGGGVDGDSYSEKELEKLIKEGKVRRYSMDETDKFGLIDTDYDIINELENELENGGVKYIPYKDEEIMYEPTYNKYYVNDEEFDSLKEAQNYIDGGSPMSAQTINAYRRGAMKDGGGISTTFANGGGVNKGKELWFSPSGEIKAEKKGTAKHYIEQHLAKRFGAESMELVGEDEKDYIYELNGNPMMIAAQTAILEEENGLDIETYGRKKRVHIPKSGIDQTSVHLRYPLITPFKNGGGIYFKKYSTIKGGVKNYSVDIDLENGEQLRGGDLDFKDGNDALFLYKRVKQKGEYQNEKIEDIQLIVNFKNGDYETVDIPNYANGGGVGTKNKYQTAKEYFEDLYSKMNSNQKSIYNKEYTRLAKYFGDDESSFSDKDVAEYIESTINELVDSDYKLQAHSITIPFFKLGHKYIAYWNAYKQPEWWDGNEYKNGGFVGKGELVWRKLSSSDRIDFLYKNFTPEITPRSQEILVGKTYNFLPRNVKMALNSKYANVEEYKSGGSVGRKRHLYAIMMGKYSQMDNPQYVEVSGRDMDEAMSKFKQMGVDAVPEHIHFSNKPPYYYKNGGGVGIDSQIEELEAVKAILNNKLLDISMGVVDRREKPKVENQMQIISSQINELLKKKYGRKMTNGGGLDTDDFEMDNSTYTIRMWDTDMDKLNRVEPLQMTYKIKSQALDLANRFYYENNYGIVEVEDENGNRILTLDAYAANGKSISMNVTECERCHQPTDNVTTMSMFNEDVICMSCKEKERKNPHYEKAHAADIEQIKQGNYNYEGMGYLPDNYYQHAISRDNQIYTGDSYINIISQYSSNFFHKDISFMGYVDNTGEFYDVAIGTDAYRYANGNKIEEAADGKPIQEADYLTNAMLSVLDLKNYLDSHNDQIIINGSKYNYYSHGQYNLRVTGGQGAIYNIIPYFPETTVGQLQNAKFYTLLRKLKTYSFAISVDGLVLDVAEDGLAIA